MTEQGGTPSAELDRVVERIARSGATPLAVADGSQLLGVIELKDIVKQGIASGSPRCGRWASAR